MSTLHTLRPVILCVLDGWGVREDCEDNAITRAKTPNFRSYWDRSPHAYLEASEEFVGLPKGQIGNSEVGHMNLGAGRVIYQDLPMIDRAIARGELATNEALLNHIAALKKSGGRCHLMGLLSPGGVHAHQRHALEVVRILTESGIDVSLHAFLDGRDVPPKNAATSLAEFEKALGAYKKAQLATLIGRYYAMDRDQRWERVEKAYNLICLGEGKTGESPIRALEESYQAGVTDEFVLPVVLPSYKHMRDGDSILFINFRADRAREILTAFTDPHFKGFPRRQIIRFAAVTGMVIYSETLSERMTALFPPKLIEMGLGEIVAEAGLKQLRIAETEKYPHVTFFFNGGREAPYDGEERIMVPSPKVATYDLKPEMSARELTDQVIAAIVSGRFDFIVMNYANPDMVGHTGSFVAAKQAIEVIDECLGRLFASVKNAGGMMILTADHGNCEMMKNPISGEPHTAHTLEKVPLMLINPPKGIVGLRNGKLADVAPTILSLMGRAIPPVMDGKDLLVRDHA